MPSQGTAGRATQSSLDRMGNHCLQIRVSAEGVRDAATRRLRVGACQFQCRGGAKPLRVIAKSGKTGSDLIRQSCRWIDPLIMVRALHAGQRVTAGRGGDGGRVIAQRTGITARGTIERDRRLIPARRQGECEWIAQLQRIGGKACQTPGVGTYACLIDKAINADGLMIWVDVGILTAVAEFRSAVFTGEAHGECLSQAKHRCLVGPLQLCSVGFAIAMGNQVARRTIAARPRAARAGGIVDCSIDWRGDIAIEDVTHDMSVAQTETQPLLALQ